MSKRFTDTDIWEKEWFMDLSLKHKCLVRFLFDRCDAAGVWDPNFTLASAFIGERVNREDLVALGDQIEILENGKIFIKDFIGFQYGTLSEDCRPHKKVFELLFKHGIADRVLNRVSNRVSDTLQYKEEDIYKDKEEDKDKEEEEEKDARTFQEKEFDSWMTDNYPRVQKLEKPLTFSQAQKLKQKWEIPRITDVLRAMNNKKDLLKKYVSAYDTAINWLKLSETNKNGFAKNDRQERIDSVNSFEQLTEQILSSAR